MDLPLDWMSASSLLSRTLGGGCFRLVVLGKEEEDVETSGGWAVAAVAVVKMDV
jgi:hypothetical protein